MDRASIEARGARTTQEMLQGVPGATANKLQIHVVLIAQLNRATEKQADKRPSLANLRDSGGIEQNANLVLMPYREGYYDSDAP